MTIKNCITRRTGNRSTKITTVSQKNVNGKNAICFYSAYDECGYIYPGYSVYDAIKAYENDTRFQGYSAIHYNTYDEEIAEEFDKLPPF